MNRSIEAIREARRALRSVDHVEARSRVDSELLELLAEAAALSREAHALLVTGAAEVEKRSDSVLGEQGLARRHGHRTCIQLLEQVTGASAASARKWARVGVTVTPRTSETGLPLPALFPQAGAALETGRLDLDAADVITRELGKASNRAPVEHLEAAERALVAEATGTETGVAKSADLVGVQARQWRDALDPDGIEPRADEAFARRGIIIGKLQHDGVHPIRGWVTPEIAGQFFMLTEAVFTPKSAPKFVPARPGATENCQCGSVRDGSGREQHLDEHNDGGPAHDDGASGVGASGPGAQSASACACGDARNGDEPGGRLRETRTTAQQAHDLLAAAVTAFAKTSTELTVAGAAPTVLVTVQADTLAHDVGTGTMVGLQDPVPLSTVKQTICDGVTRRVLLGEFGEVVAMETEQRLFTRTQRLAIIARDGPTCFCCQIPAIATEAHHVVEWANGGRTRIDNGVMLCYAHHRAAERGEIGFEFVNGKPRLIAPPWLQRVLNG